MATQNPTVYSPRPWKFNTGDVSRGAMGVVDVPAGASNVLTAEELAHPFAKVHCSTSPIAGVPAGGSASGDDFAKLQARLDAVIAERDQLAAANKSQGEELEALRTAIGQTATEREAALEAQLRASSAETADVRGQLARAQDQLKAAQGTKK